MWMLHHFETPVRGLLLMWLQVVVVMMMMKLLLLMLIWLRFCERVRG